MNTGVSAFRATILVALLSLVASAARADVIYDVTLDTSALAANPDQGKFYVDLELIPNSFVASTATISTFSFGAGGSAMPGAQEALFRVPPVGVDLVASGLTLTAGDFNQAFTPGSEISFTKPSAESRTPTRSSASKGSRLEIGARRRRHDRTQRGLHLQALQRAGCYGTGVRGECGRRRWCRIISRSART